MTDKSSGEQWIVQVFRRSMGAGWEALQVSSSKTKPRKNNAVCTNFVYASLGKGSILLPRLRFRVKLQSDTVVTRRQHAVRVQSKQGVRVLVLVFQSLADCDKFCDALIRLNPLPSPVRQDATTMPLVHHFQEDKKSVLFYVARLLYDPEFMSLVGTIEDSVFSSHEGQKMLQDLNELVPHKNKDVADGNSNNNNNGDNVPVTTTIPGPSPFQC